MASIKKFELIATVGTYKDAAGTTQKRWMVVGCVFESTGGKLSAKLDALPLGEWSGFLSFKPVMPPGRRSSPGMPEAAESQPNELEDDKPF